MAKGRLVAHGTLAICERAYRATVHSKRSFSPWRERPGARLRYELHTTVEPGSLTLDHWTPCSQAPTQPFAKCALRAQEEGNRAKIDSFARGRAFRYVEKVCWPFDLQCFSVAGDGVQWLHHGLQRLATILPARVRNIAGPSDTIRVSPYTEKELIAVDKALRSAAQISDPASRKGYEERWNNYLDRLFRSEIRRKHLSGWEEETAQLKQMHDAFASEGAAGFTAPGAHTFQGLAEAWPREAEAKDFFLRVLGLVVFLWIPALVFGALGMNNKDLGQVEWSFEWLYTFPASARALFASKLLGHAFFSPLAWLFFLPFMIQAYVAGGHGWMALPLGFAAVVWVLLLVGAVTTICEVAMRKFLSLSQLKNIQALFTVFSMASFLLVIASSISRPVDDFLVGQAASLGVLEWNPFALPLYLGVPSATARQIQIGAFGMIALAICAVSTALLGSEWLTREGLIRAGGPYQGNRQMPTAESGRGWLRGIAAHELLLLARDRNLMVQVLIGPMLVPVYCLLTNSEIVASLGTNFRNAAMLAFVVGAYSFLNSAMPSPQPARTRRCGTCSPSHTRFRPSC